MNEVVNILASLHEDIHNAEYDLCSEFAECDDLSFSEKEDTDKYMALENNVYCIFNDLLQEVDDKLAVILQDPDSFIKANEKVPFAAWIHYSRSRFVCTNCHNGVTNRYPYCPHCGFPMANSYNR